MLGHIHLRSPTHYIPELKLNLELQMDGALVTLLDDIDFENNNNKCVIKYLCTYIHYDYYVIYLHTCMASTVTSSMYTVMKTIAPLHSSVCALTAS